MLTSLAFIFLVGLGTASICKFIKLPRIIGMLLTGIILGPYVLDLLDPSILGISAELRQFALVIILIKAGLSLNLSDLKKVGRPAVLMSFLPALFEIAAFVIFAPMILKINHIEAALMGAVLGAVSPAVVVPRMVDLMEAGYGTKKSIPQLVLAGSSLDDVFVIVLFSAFLGMAQGEETNFAQFADIPISIIAGIILGALTGLFLAWFFETSYSNKYLIRNSTKTIIILGFSFTLLAVEDLLKGRIAVSGLLAIMSMSMVLAMKCVPEVTKRLQEKFGKLWIAAEVILFVLVGAAVDIRYTLEAGPLAVLMIFIGLAFRSVGVLVCLIKTPLNMKEKLYCIIAYLPKATVQAAIGSVAMSLGLPCGKLVLSVAVLSIIITAPLGAILMDVTYKKLLTKDEQGNSTKQVAETSSVAETSDAE